MYDSNPVLRNPLPTNPQAEVEYAGLTLREYFQRTQRIHNLGKIQEEESQSELQYQRKEPGIKKKKHLQSLTKLQGEQVELNKILGRVVRVDKKLTPNKKYSFNYQNVEPKMMNKLPVIHKRSFSPQIKNLKLQIMNKFRQNTRIKTQVSEGYNSKKSKKDQPIAIQISKKQLMSKGQAGIKGNSNSKGKNDNNDGFMLTFQKTKGKKFSDVYLSNANSTRNAKAS